MSWTAPGGRVTRNAEGGQLFEAFLVAAVSTVLLGRWLLDLTGYPRLGGSGLHVAHLLWGGLLMLLALLLMLLFLDRRVQYAAAVVSGVGFGISRRRRARIPSRSTSRPSLVKRSGGDGLTTSRCPRATGTPLEPWALSVTTAELRSVAVHCPSRSTPYGLIPRSVSSAARTFAA
jgi:hypothetical protein